MTIRPAEALPAAAGPPPKGARAPASPRAASTRAHALVLRHSQFLLYAVIGGGGVIIDLGIFAVLIAVGGMHVLLANTISTAIAVVYSFAANSYGTFKVTNRLLLRFASFAAVAGVGFVVSSLIIGVSVGILGLPPLLAKAITLPVVLILQFSLNKTITFRSRTEGTHS